MARLYYMFDFCRYFTFLGLALRGLEYRRGGGRKPIHVPPVKPAEASQPTQARSPNRAREAPNLLVFDGHVKFRQSEIVDAGRSDTAESGLFFNLVIGVPP